MKKVKLYTADVKRVKELLILYYSKVDYEPSKEEWNAWLQTLENHIREHYILMEYEESKSAPNCKYFCFLNNEEHQMDLDEFMRDRLTISAYWYWRNHRYELSILFNNATYQAIREKEYEKEREEKEYLEKDKIVYKECSSSLDDQDDDEDDY